MKGGSGGSGFRFFFAMKNAPTFDRAAFTSQSDCSDKTFWQSVDKTRSYLNEVVSEIRWSQRLDEFNHSPHFPFLVTHFTDAMPIASIGGALSDVLFNPKYAGNIYKVTVAVDFLGNIVWICPLSPGTTPDVLIWDQHGPQRTRGDFLDFEVGLHDGAYKGRIHTVIPFPGRGKLTERQQQYNDVHGWYRARVEHLFAQLWQWKVVRNIWQGGETELHETMRILLHMEQFVNSRKVRYQPYGPWPHVPEGLWTNTPLVIPTEEGDDESVLAACQLCGKPSVKTCGSCNLAFCNDCAAGHTC